MTLQQITITGDKQYKCLCVFHKENTASLSINIQKQAFYCFGCGTKGSLHVIAKKLGYEGNDIFDWVNELEDNLKLHTNSFKLKPRIELGHRMDESWYAPFKGKILKRFMIERGLSVDILRKFETGYDQQKNYVTWTYRNFDGAFLGAVGRKALNELPGSKYLWYWIQSKPVMWGSQFVQKEEPIYITEGMVDCMKLHQFGYINSVASGGIPTEIQLQTVSLHKKIILAFDNDFAGKKMTREVGYKLLKILGLDLCVLEYQGKDVGELLNSQTFSEIPFFEWENKNLKVIINPIDI